MPSGSAARSRPITGAEAPQFPITNEKTQSVAWVNADGFVRYFFARDPKLSPFQFSPEKFAGRIKEISEMFDTTDPDSGQRCHEGWQGGAGQSRFAGRFGRLGRFG
jgi:hypothetical protein